MKKTKHTLLTAAALTAAMNMATASNVNAVTLGDAETPVRAKYDPSTAEVQDVYGPAPNYYDEPVYFTTTNNEPITTSEIQTTYGPPIWMQDVDTTTVVTEPVVAPIYGPPWVFPGYTGTIPPEYTTTTIDEPVTTQPGDTRAWWEGDTFTTTVTTTTTEPSPLYGPPQIFYQPGDINGDQVIDALDLVVFRKYLLREDIPAWLKYDVLDVNDDGYFNIGDVVALQNFILGRRANLHDPATVIPQPTYGPVPDIEDISLNVTTTSPKKTRPVTTSDKNKTTTTTAYATTEPVTSLDPDKMPVQLMYGPPEYFGLDPDTLQPKEK